LSSLPPNIAILLTPPGVAAIAVVRLRGARVPEFLSHHFSKPVKLNRCVHADLFDAETILDDALIVLTDPQTADLNIHGGQWVIRSVLDLAAREGFDAIESGDLPIPFEATDCPTLLEREIEAYLPMAKTELGVRTLLAQKAQWETVAARATQNPASIQNDLPSILSDRTLEHLLTPPAVAIVGPANVGKSTLANRLFAQERSITADVPGTTRDWVGEIANIDGLPILLLDTPGLRPTHDPIEATAITRSRDEIARAALVVLVFDTTRPLQGEQAELLTRFPGAIVVVNKSDCPPSPEIQSVTGIRTIATTGAGIDDLRSAIATHFCGQSPVDPIHPRIWTPRQRQIVEQALSNSAALDEIFARHAPPKS
jgi:tRNA modification GTPase